MNFSPKRQAEIEVFSVDFAPLLPPGVTIVTAVWSNTTFKDATAASMLRGGNTIAGSVVSHLIGGGVIGVTYTPKCTATCSDGQVLILPDQGSGQLLVEP